MTSSELSLRLARLSDATTIANLSRDLIEYGLRWRWTPMRVAASIRAPDVNVLVAGIFSVTLEVRAGNEGTQLFYKRMGYRPLAHVPGYYQGTEAALRMGRDLSLRPLGQ